MGLARDRELRASDRNLPAQLGIVSKWGTVEEANIRQELIQASIQLLDEYRRGDRAAFISQAERDEQQLRGGLNLEEQAIVRRLLALSEDVETQEVALKAVGLSRAQALLRTVVARPRQPQPRLVLEPYLERASAGVSWLLERVEVGVTGINVNARFWTTWPPDARLGSTPDQQHCRLQWRGHREITDDTGRRMQFVGGAITPALTQIATEDVVGQRYSIMQREWWRPGVAPESRAITLCGEVAIVVHKWVGGDAGAWIPETIDLGPFQCTMRFPDNWQAGTFTAVSW
jgi:hypothetical protein